MSAHPPPPPGFPLPPPRRRWQPSTWQIQLVAFIVVLAIANVAYRLVYTTGTQQTAALYVGVPAILAISLALIPNSKSAVGVLVKGTTLATLLAAVVLPEGILCLLFAYPLVIVIAVLVGATVDFGIRRDRRKGESLAVVALPLLLFSLEGVVASPFDSSDSATSSIVVAATPDEVAAAVASPPTFDADLPIFLRLGFNHPVAATGSGIEIGDRRMIHFSGGSHDDHPLSLAGMVSGAEPAEHTRIDLVVVESGPGRVVFAVDDDTTMLARWAELQRATVTWEAVDENTTRVWWRLDYDRQLDPTLYFAPVQRYGMDRAADYLLQSVVVDQVG